MKSRRLHRSSSLSRVHVSGRHRRSMTVSVGRKVLRLLSEAEAAPLRISLHVLAISDAMFGFDKKANPNALGYSFCQKKSPSRSKSASHKPGFMPYRATSPICRTKEFATPLSHRQRCLYVHYVPGEHANSMSSATSISRARRQEHQARLVFPSSRRIHFIVSIM